MKFKKIPQKRRKLWRQARLPLPHAPSVRSFLPKKTWLMSNRSPDRWVSGAVCSAIIKLLHFSAVISRPSPVRKSSPRSEVAVEHGTRQRMEIKVWKRGRRIKCSTRGKPLERRVCAGWQCFLSPSAQPNKRRISPNIVTTERAFKTIGLSSSAGV